MAFRVPEAARVISGPYATTPDDGNNGMFILPYGKKKRECRCIASDGAGWNHVSVTLTQARCPTYEEMNAIKNLFWDATDTVMQLHPAQSAYVNIHKYCLHLWQPNNGLVIPVPPQELV